MKRAKKFLSHSLSSALLALPFAAFAQPWSGIVTPPRAIDWSTVGVIGGIPLKRPNCDNASCNFLATTGEVTASTIETALNSASVGGKPCDKNNPCVVRIRAGMFTTGGIIHSKNWVTLRGAGADKTILKLNSLPDRSCHIGEGRVFSFCADGLNIGLDSPTHTASWNSGYAQGATAITLSNVTGLTVGSPIWLDQTDEPSDGYPAAGDIYLCNVEGSNCSNEGGGSSYGRAGRALVEGHVVTACGTSVSGAACTSTSVTIFPGVMMPSVRSARTPQAWWGNREEILEGAGLEDMTIDATPCGAGCGIVFAVNATNSWIKGVRMLQTACCSGNVFLFFTANLAQFSFVDNYIWGPDTVDLVANYKVAIHITSRTLFQNNILQTGANAFVPNSSGYGNVIAYNLQDNTISPGVIDHGLSGMQLIEGNNFSGYSSDVIHGPHFFNTFFRNHFDGLTRNPNSTIYQTQNPITLYANSRFFNVVGNVMNSGQSTVYQTLNAFDNSAIYVLGWQGSGSGSTIANDFNVNRTLMRWGNWDNVSNTNRFVAAEVPSGITNYPNAVPTSQALPASFYLSSKPAWFGSVPFPPIGPDVTGGNIQGNYGGHASRIPARVCFETLAQDSANYPGTSIKRFLPQLCYGSGSGSATQAVDFPKNIRIQ